MTAHTPWIAHKSPDSHDYAYSLQDDDIAFLLFDFHPDVKDERRREIARLIAACPDLLDALIKLSNEVIGSLPLMEPLARREMGNTNYAILIQRAEEARAVIAKAVQS